jgi:hypothetical protein
VSDYGQKLQAIRKYLEEQFSGHPVEDEQTAAADVPSFAVSKDGEHYELQVDRDFLDRFSLEELRDALQRWRVADEVRRAEGLPIILTERGVRLVSSN